MTHTNTEGLSDAVTREDAIKFLEGACRNWSKVPRLSEEDIGDVASELLRFALSRRSASNTGGVEVKAAALAQAYLRGVEWRDENPGHVDYAYRFKAAGDYADKATSSLAAEAEPVVHPDDLAVDQFAAAMKAKLAKKRGEGRSGWEDKEACSALFLSSLLHGHVIKGDPVDVANLAMMLHQRGETILQTPNSAEHDPHGATFVFGSRSSPVSAEVTELTVDEVERIIIDTEPPSHSDHGDKVWTRRMAVALADRLSALNGGRENG